MKQDFKSRVLSSLFWKLMERGGTQGIQFAVQLVLARLLLPEEFGVIALVTVFISLARVFVQSGFSTALIQKKNSDELDFSSVFYLSLVVAVLLYSLIYISAPVIAKFYNNPILVNVLRVLSISLFFGVYNSLQNAYIAKNMLFKKLFLSSLGAIIASGITGVVAAIMGLGVWALVIQQLTNQAFIVLIMFFTVKWRPSLVFSFERVKVLFSFGSRLLVSSLLNTLYLDIRTLLIGRIYSSSMLGYYNRGEQFPKVIVANIDGSIQAVMLPTLSSSQDDVPRIKQMVRRTIITSSFFIFPIMIGMAVVAEPLVKFVLTDKWLSAVPFLQISCISYAFIPIHTANLQAINAMGRSDIFLKLEIIKKIVGIIILILSIPLGIYAIAWGQVIGGITSTIINAYPNNKLLNYSYKEQLFDIIPSLGIAFLMGAMVYILSFLEVSVSQMLFLQVNFGIVMYFLMAKLFRIESYEYLVKTIKEIINVRKNAS